MTDITLNEGRTMPALGMGTYNREAATTSPLLFLGSNCRQPLALTRRINW